MRWTLGLLLLAAAGCGYHQTKMVACPETGCETSYAARSPEDLPGPEPGVRPPTSHEHVREPGLVDAAAGRRRRRPPTEPAPLP